MLLGRVSTALLFFAVAFAAADTPSLSSRVEDVEHKAARLPIGLDLQFRMAAAQALQSQHPELARPLARHVLEHLRDAKDNAIGSRLIRALVEIAPDDTIAALGHDPNSLPDLIASLSRTGHADSALALYRDGLSQGKVGVRSSLPLINEYAHKKPALAAQLFHDSVATFAFDRLEPWDAWFLLTTAETAAVATPTAAADLYERILTAVSDPAYGRESRSSVTATFELAGKTVATENSRDTLLVAAAGRLHKLAPQRLDKFRTVLDRWNFSDSFVLRGFNIRPPGAGPATAPPSAAALTGIRQGTSQFRGLPTDAERARLAIDLAARIRALPAGEKLGVARGLANVSTEGDLGKEALTAVAGALGQALRETPAAEASDWLQLAGLIRYERVPAPYTEPALDTAAAVLLIRETLAQQSGFSLPSLDGKTWSLSALRGRVVLLNFWATWCPPCRKEMPDMEKLHHAFEKKGLTILAVSDEERGVVTAFQEKMHYSFPVLLDPAGKAHADFSIDGIPKTFLFDRDGKLVAESMDMRTERQFREMLKLAGLE